jgi:hypothetical protein
MEDIDAPSQNPTVHSSSQPEGSSLPSAAQWLQQGKENKFPQPSPQQWIDSPQPPVAGITQTEYFNTHLDILYGEEEPTTPTPTPYVLKPVISYSLEKESITTKASIPGIS